MHGASAIMGPAYSAGVCLPERNPTDPFSVPQPQDEAVINVNRLTLSMPRCIGLALRAMLG